MLCHSAVVDRDVGHPFGLSYIPVHPPGTQRLPSPNILPLYPPPTLPRASTPLPKPPPPSTLPSHAPTSPHPATPLAPTLPPRALRLERGAWSMAKWLHKGQATKNINSAPLLLFVFHNRVWVAYVLACLRVACWCDVVVVGRPARVAAAGARRPHDEGALSGRSRGR